MGKANWVEDIVFGPDLGWTRPAILGPTVKHGEL